MLTSMRLLMTALLTVLCFGPVQAYESYEDYALRLIRTLPEGTKFRPDLEAYLNARASRTRQQRDRRAARAQAVEMLLGDFVGHESSTGHRFAARFEAFAGPGDHGRFGENAARDRQDAKPDKSKASAIFDQWLESTGHRRNLLHRDYRYVSTGVVQQGNHLYAIQIFWEK
jgi:hypothetical protein